MLTQRFGTRDQVWTTFSGERTKSKCLRNNRVLHNECAITVTSQNLQLSPLSSQLPSYHLLLRIDPISMYISTATLPTYAVGLPFPDFKPTSRNTLVHSFAFKYVLLSNTPPSLVNIAADRNSRHPSFALYSISRICEATAAKMITSVERHRIANHARSQCKISCLDEDVTMVFRTLRGQARKVLLALKAPAASAKLLSAIWYVFTI